MKGVLEDFISTSSNPRGNTPLSALTMIKLSMLEAWTELYNATKRIQDLNPIVDANIENLMKLWMEVLEEYAKLSIDNDSESGEQGISSGVYASAFRDVTLPVLSYIIISFIRKPGYIF